MLVRLWQRVSTWWHTAQDVKAIRMAEHPLFAELNRTDLIAVSSVIERITLRQGTLLAKQGYLTMETFVILSGLASVELDGVPVGVIDVSQTVGIAARKEEVAHGATVRAVTDMDVYMVDPRGVRTFLTLVPQAASSDWSDLLPRADAEIAT